MRFMILAAVAALAFASAADAKTCKDGAGKFIKCPAPAAAPAKAPKAPKAAKAAKAAPAKAAPAAKAAPVATAAKPATTRCKDAKGHFTACPAPAAAAKPMSAAPAAPAAPAKATKTASSSPRTGADRCKIGKPCGKGCIPKDKVCHKN